MAKDDKRKLDPCLIPADRLVELYRSGGISPVEVAQATLDRIERFNPVVNALCLVDREAVLREAEASEARWRKGDPKGLVDGVTCTIKDLVLTRGWPTLRGSRTIDPDQPWDIDGPVVARLREHGAVLIGKTTMPEFGWKGVGNSPVYGTTRNPWNIALTPGGSSSGAAAAAALSMGALHIGSDGGGSIRIPAAFTGIYGIKPTFGRVPAYPLSPFGTVAHLGPMTRTVAEAALMLTVIAQPDARDWHALPYEGIDYRAGLEDGVKGLRVAYSPDLGYASVDPEVRALVDRAAATLSNLGAVVEEASPGFDDPEDIFNAHWFSGAANLLSRIPEEKYHLIDPGLLEIGAKGKAWGHLDYLAATDARGQLGERMRQFHQRYDVLLTAAMPITAFPVGREVPDESYGERWMSWSPFSYPFNLTQQPAASMPCGFTKAGLPAAVQIVGDKYADALVLRVSRALEQVMPIELPDAPMGTA